ncbi:MAG: B3/4 domain-containing protein [Thomasclavelia ramosa]
MAKKCTYLMASGIKPINNIVDISNFVMLETGQPIHMYDYDKLNKKEFIIKTGFDCKEVMLDGEEYKIEPADLIVSTDAGIGCIAGVMGANSTKIDENTTNIVIEAATFDGASIKRNCSTFKLID